MSPSVDMVGTPMEIFRGRNPGGGTCMDGPARGLDGSVPLLIQGGTLIDGTGVPATKSDILIEGGRIREIAAPGQTTGEGGAVLNAQGLVVCPGFIDAHSHADNAPLLSENDLTKIRQGVTTEVTGNCGFSLAPICSGEGASDAVSSLRKIFVFDEVTWSSTAELYEAIDHCGTVTNICPLVGHGSVRQATMGASSRAAEPDDVRRMQALVSEALEAGAFGISTGLIYAPGVYAAAAELTQIAAVLGPNGVYATHMRNESFDVLSSLAESVSLARAAGCRLQISHLKATGAANHGVMAQAMAVLDKARDEGLMVTQDVYPYTAASTMLASCMPPWMHDGGDRQLCARLADRRCLIQAREAVESENVQAWENPIRDAGGYDGILVASSGSHKYEGRTLAEVGADLGMLPFDALVYVLLSERLRVTMVEFSMADRDLDEAFRSPFTCIGSDGLAPGSGGKPHPRLFGSFPTAIRRFVRERQIVDLPEVVRKMTSLPAAIFGVPDRGVLTRNAVADLVCFDPTTIDHPGDYASPDDPPVGIAWVMQEGALVVRDDQWLGRRRGRRLRPL